MKINIEVSNSEIIREVVRSLLTQEVGVPGTLLRQCLPSALLWYIRSGVVAAISECKRKEDTYFLNEFLREVESLYNKWQNRESAYYGVKGRKERLDGSIGY